MTIIWSMVPEIWSMTDRIFLSFWTFFALKTWKIKILKKWKNKKKKTSGDIIILPIRTKNHDHMLYCSWDMTLTDVTFISHFGLFFALLPSNSLKNENSKKNEKKHLEVSSFYTSVPKIMIIWYTVPEIWHMTDVIVIFHFGLFFALSPFCPFALKNENFTKMKKCLEISSFYTSVPKIMIICYTVPEIWYVMYVIVIFHFGLFFALLLPYQPKNSKFQKNKKNTWRYHHFTHVYQKLWLDDVRFLRYGARQMDGWTNRQKKWHIEVSAPPKNDSKCSFYNFPLLVPY